MARRTELAVRTALGSSRTQIARLMLAEAVVIALAGGIAGWLIAGAALPVLLRFADPSTPRLADAVLDVTVLTYCVAASLASAILAGLVPAVRLSHANLQVAMRAETRLQRERDHRTNLLARRKRAGAVSVHELRHARREPS